MPIYEYQCPKCGVVEVMQGITEPGLKKCPNCKSKVDRLMSRSSFVLKGSGWYATDYAQKGERPKRTKPDSGRVVRGQRLDGERRRVVDRRSDTASKSAEQSGEKSSESKSSEKSSKTSSAIRNLRPRKSRKRSDKSSSAKSAD